MESSLRNRRFGVKEPGRVPNCVAFSECGRQSGDSADSVTAVQDAVATTDAPAHRFSTLQVRALWLFRPNWGRADQLAHFTNSG